MSVLSQQEDLDPEEQDRVEAAGGEVYLRLQVFRGDLALFLGRALDRATADALRSNATVEEGLVRMERGVVAALGLALEAARAREALLAPDPSCPKP
jgi:hypothetical protein